MYLAMASPRGKNNKENFLGKLPPRAQKEHISRKTKPGISSDRKALSRVKFVSRAATFGPSWIGQLMHSTAAAAAAAAAAE